MTAIVLPGTIYDSIVSPWAWWTADQATGTTLTEKTGKTGLTGQSITGTTTNVWTDTPGWFTPDPTAGNSVIIPASAANAIFSLDDLSAGGVLVVCEINIGANPGADSEDLWQYGLSSAGYRLSLTYGANANIIGAVRNVGGSDTSTPSANISAVVGDNLIVALYVDISNGFFSMYVNEPAARKATSLPTDGTAMIGASTPSIIGLGIFGRSTGGSLLGQAGTGSGTTMRSLFAIRFTTDQSSLVPAIIQGFMDNSRQLPEILRGQ